MVMMLSFEQWCFGGISSKKLLQRGEQNRLALEYILGFLEV